jgi:hypothetical protein
MVRSNQHLLMFEDQPFHVAEIWRGNAAIMSETHRIQPELGFPIWRTDVNVRGLMGFVGVKVEAVRAYSQNRRHDEATWTRGRSQATSPG